MAITSVPRRRLLWVDDDGPERFLYEGYVFKTNGWDLHWAKSIDAATVTLAMEPFEAILLDQMLPTGFSDTDGVEHADVWGGCLVLYWLRGLDKPPAAPLGNQLGEASFQRTPHPANRALPAIIVSAFYDDEVEAAVAQVQGAVPLFSKPLDITVVLDLLNSRVGRG